MAPNKIARIPNLNLEIPVSPEEKKYRKIHHNSNNVLSNKLKCTACSLDITRYVLNGQAIRHSQLKVLICWNCERFYGDGNFSVDEDGEAKYCRWCGQGGALFLCDKCDSGFCKDCIKRNFGSGCVREIEDADSWNCYICSPEPLFDLRAQASQAISPKRRNANITYRKGRRRQEGRRSKKISSSSDNSDSEKLSASQSDCEIESVEQMKTPNFKDLRRKTLFQKARNGVEKHLCELSKLFQINSSMLAEIVSDLLSEEKTTNLSDVVKVELEIQEFIITIIDSLNRISMELASEVGQLESFRTLKSDEDCEEENDRANEELNDEKENVKDDDEFDVISLVSSCVASSVCSKKNEEREAANLFDADGQQDQDNKSILYNNLLADFNDSDCDNDSTSGINGLSSDPDDDDETLASAGKDVERRSSEDDEPKTGKNVADSESECELKDSNSDNKRDSEDERSVVSKTKTVDSDSVTDFDSDNNEPRREIIEKKKEDLNKDESPESLAENEEVSKTPEPKGKNEDDEINRLTNLNSLKRKKSRILSSDGESGSNSDASVISNQKSAKKKQKVEEELKKSDILDILNASDNDETLVEEDDEDLFMLSKDYKKSFSDTVNDDMPIFSDSDKNSGKGVSSNESEDEENKNEKIADGKSEATTEFGSDKHNDSEDSSDWILTPKKKPSWRSDKLLTQKLSSTDTSDEEKGKTSSLKKRKEYVKSGAHSRKNLNNDLANTISDDSDGESSTTVSTDSSIEIISPKSKKRKNRISSGSIQTISSRSSDSEEEFIVKKDKIWKKKKRTKLYVSSSDDSCQEVENFLNTSSQSQSQDLSGRGRRNIRRVMKDEDLAEATRIAAKEEEERKQRVLDRQKQYNTTFKIADGNGEKMDKLVLDFDPSNSQELICVEKELVSKMKPHQVEGVKFMWDACFESVNAIKTSEGGGCILAHCMGLGKTFQVISLVHTLLMHKAKSKVRSVLIVCPLSTVLNWHREFKKWLNNLGFQKSVGVHHLSDDKTISKRSYRLKSWHENGGVMIMGYEMFRNLTNEKSRLAKSKFYDTFIKTLIDPGADLVICDEGHMLKNEATALSKSMNNIRTLRRIVLTGTPLQNNLIEYHCMVNFIKPNLLGNKKEFTNRFVNPITNGQFADSTEMDFKIMKRRAHVLHNMLGGLVQRCDYSVLKPYLPPKQEYVISIRLTELQIKLYKTFLDSEAGLHKRSLLKDWHSFSRLWTHPLALKYSMERNSKKAENGKDDNDSDVQYVPNEINKIASSMPNNDENVVDKTKEGQSEQTTAPSESSVWWEKLVSPEQMDDITVSSKLVLLFSFLKQCEMIGDKVLVFSQSLYSLDLIEYFLCKIDSLSQSDKENVCQSSSSCWKKGLDYFRLDGSTSGENRLKWIKSFNRESNSRARLFLISTRAGGLGINLTAANRVIIFDVSWNPSNDIQSIFRVYRFGQEKPCYIYRFIAQGTMEEKVYERQIAKLSLSRRVVDEQQVNRYFSQTDLQELYKFTPAAPDDMPIPMVPKDLLMADMLQEQKTLIYKVFMHDSLLDHVEEEELDDEERKAAWEDFRNEKQAAEVKETNTAERNGSSYQKMGITQERIEQMEKALSARMPSWSKSQVKEYIKRQLMAWSASRLNTLIPGTSASGTSAKFQSTNVARSVTGSTIDLTESAGSTNILNRPPINSSGVSLNSAPTAAKYFNPKLQSSIPSTSNPGFSTYPSNPKINRCVDVDLTTDNSKTISASGLPADPITGSNITTSSVITDTKSASSVSSTAIFPSETSTISGTRTLKSTQIPANSLNKVQGSSVDSTANES